MFYVETWLPIKGYPYYEVSDHGNVRSRDRIVITARGSSLPIKGQPMATVKAKRTEHRQVALTTGTTRTTLKVHRLVLEAFVGPCPPGMQACHNNGNAADNRLSNLRWGTLSSNSRDTVRHGTHNMAKRTHCKNNHEYTDENTRMVIRPTGTIRLCRTCWAAAQRRYRSKKPEAYLRVERNRKLKRNA